MRRSVTIAVLSFLGLMTPMAAPAQYRFVAEPFIEIDEVHDDNLFLSAAQRASDLILRVSPGVWIRFDAEQWSVHGVYEIDSERFSTHSELSENRARDEALVSLEYRPRPRLSLSLHGMYNSTNNPADLNLTTGLITARARAERLSFRPAAEFQVSPRTIARASWLYTTEELTGGPRTQVHSQKLGLERELSVRDRVSLDYEQGFYDFNLAQIRSSADSYLLLAGWSRKLNPRTEMTLRAGPRLIDDSAEVELLASVTHRRPSSSITVSAEQTHTTVLGHAGTVEVRNLQAMWAFTPSPSLSIFASPAIYSTSRRDLSATVYRLGVGARYEVTSLLGVEAEYSFDSQHGGLEPAQGGLELSRNVLSVGLTARWNGQESARAAPWR